MKSPFTGKEMKRVYEPRRWKFRGEEFAYQHAGWLCQDTGEMFTDDESDTAGYVQVTNQYREKYGIPYTDEIISVRKRYGISASKMSLILGIGTNQYRLYEQGEVPSVSNGRMIRSIMNPKVMLEMIDSSRNELPKKEYDKIAEKVKALIAGNEEFKKLQYETQRVFASHRSLYNGYAPLSLSRLKNVMLYVLEHCTDVWCTKMNKLLFYIDFLSYRERGMSITGLSYKAIEFGPVPDRWDVVYSEFPEVRQELRSAGDFVGSVLVPSGESDFSLFAESELEIMEAVCVRFSAVSSREVSRISHEEDAWRNHCGNHERIPFTEAFTLNAV